MRPTKNTKQGGKTTSNTPTSEARPQPAKPADPGKEALGWSHSARFLTTAAQLNQLPVTELPEVAFVGRSNAGKSTAINTMAQQRQLAFASKTPGRTQHINLFQVGPKAAPNLLWADLPGYGYAAVERTAKLRWQEVMAQYLELRRNLTGVVHMVDSRHGFTELDRNLLDFVTPRVRSGAVKLLVLLTKADKLNRKEADAAVRAAQEVLGEMATDEADISIILFSSTHKTGVADAAQMLQSWAAPDDVAQEQARQTAERLAELAAQAALREEDGDTRR
jgi:GTP-binding protein